jgi:mono/diheme cytochrome c family protein
MRFASILLVSLIVGSASGVVAVSAPRPAVDGKEDAAAGREVFLRKNCQYCHAVSAVGIERGASPAKLHGPDLSDVGLRRTADELLAYLRRGTRAAGRQHWRPFWGTNRDLTVLVGWLSSLRLPPVAEDPESR